MKTMTTMMMMAAVFLGVAGAVMGAEGGAAEFAWPGWKCRDVALIQAQRALAPETKGYRFYLAYMEDFAANGEPADLAEAAVRIQAAVRGVDPEISDDYISSLIKQYAVCNGVFFESLPAFCQAYPGGYDFHVARNLHGDWAFGIIERDLLQSKRKASDVMRGVDYLIKEGIALEKSDEEMELLLKRLNRVYSALLADDAEVWEKVVAKIRTLIETYE